ncbi:MAG: aspartate/methionine/tyrosine aminotransferase [Planctomycetota bacterium]|jgi:aspartate/methionine/tyrosine aminotransferase
MKKFQPFVMERMMSKWENVAEYNLSESGVHPMTLAELMQMAGKTVEELGKLEIGYPQTNGTLELRETIAQMYAGASADQVLVSVGAAEANYIALHTVLDPGDHMALMVPNYMQVEGIAHNHGVEVTPFALRPENGWAPDMEQLRAAVTPRTKLIAVCNPNNPTGRIMTRPEMEEVVAIADSVGAWILSDEVYRGAERETDEESPSFYGMYDKVLAQGSMSKAYGLPGLRLGWTAGPADMLDEMWARREYTTISTTKLSNELAAIALSAQVRPKILARTRGYIRAGFPILQAWVEQHGDMFTMAPSQAAAVAFLRYDIDINSTELIKRLYQNQKTLIVPGDHFDLDHHVRISFGLPQDYLNEGLRRVQVELGALQGV